MIGAAILIGTYRRFRLTTLAYTLAARHATLSRLHDRQLPVVLEAGGAH